MQHAKDNTMRNSFAINTKHHCTWVNFQLEHVVSHPGWQPLTKVFKKTTMAPPFHTEAYNKPMNTKHHHIWLNLQFEHIVGHLGSHLGWRSLSKISKMTIMAVPFNIETCNEHQHHHIWLNLPLKHVVSKLGSYQPLTKI